MGVQRSISAIFIMRPIARLCSARHDGAMTNSLFRSFTHSRDGLLTAWQDDRSFRVSACQFAVGFVVATAILAADEIGILTWLLLIGATMPILVVETINTAIEAVTDKASPERHPLAKKAKDIGSAAVLLTRVYAMLTWVVVLAMAAHSQTAVPAT